MKALTRNEMVKWIVNSKTLGATQISNNIIVLRRINKHNKKLTLKEEILIKRLFGLDIY